MTRSNRHRRLELLTPEGRQCTTKKAFRSPAAANRYVRTKLSFPGARGGKRMRSYQCRLCSKYHLTSQPEPKKMPEVVVLRRKAGP